MVVLVMKGPMTACPRLVAVAAGRVQEVRQQQPCTGSLSRFLRHRTTLFSSTLAQVALADSVLRHQEGLGHPVGEVKVPL